MIKHARFEEAYTRHKGGPGQEVRIRINPGGHYVTSGNELLVTVLGSCVAACIRDPVAGIGGMNHFMLPQSDSGIWGIASASMRFGNFAMETLINDILSQGGHRDNLEIKVFGGAAIIGNMAPIGISNADFRRMLPARGRLADRGPKPAWRPRQAKSLPSPHRTRPHAGDAARRTRRGPHRADLRRDPAFGTRRRFHRIV
jgi:chemotaxis receptor (MCP) glutamine deamidase CheD